MFVGGYRPKAMNTDICDNFRNETRFKGQNENTRSAEEFNWWRSKEEIEEAEEKMRVGEAARATTLFPK